MTNTTSGPPTYNRVCPITFSNIDTTGSTGQIHGSTISSVNSTANLTNIADLSIDGSEFLARAVLICPGAAELTLTRVTVSSLGQITSSAGTSLTALSSTLDSGGRIQCEGGTLILDDVHATADGLVRQYADTPGTNTMSGIHVSSEGQARFRQGADGCSITGSSAKDRGVLEHHSGSTNSVLQGCHAVSAASVFTENAVDALVRYSTAFNLGQTATRNTTAATTMERCHSTSSALLWLENSSGGIMRSCSASDQGQLRVQGMVSGGLITGSRSVADYSLIVQHTTATAIGGLFAYGAGGSTAINPPSGTAFRNF